MHKYGAVIRWDGERFYARCPELNVADVGPTLEEAARALTRRILERIEYLKEIGAPLPRPRTEGGAA